MNRPAQRQRMLSAGFTLVEVLVALAIVAVALAAGLRARLEAEYERQSGAVAFRVPEFADKPPADGSLPTPKDSAEKKTGKKKKKAEAAK